MTKQMPLSILRSELLESVIEQPALKLTSGYSPDSNSDNQPPLNIEVQFFSRHPENRNNQGRDRSPNNIFHRPCSRNPGLHSDSQYFCILAFSSGFSHASL